MQRLRPQRIVVVDPLPVAPPRREAPPPTSADSSSLSSAELDAACKLLTQAGKMAYASLAAYCRWRGLPLPEDLPAAGQAAARRTRLARLPVKKLPDPRVQLINAYPIHILDELFAVSDNPVR